MSLLPSGVFMLPGKLAANYEMRCNKSLLTFN
jgi:hypothetical protein